MDWSTLERMGHLFHVGNEILQVIDIQPSFKGHRDEV
jgi:hypothetical protein